MNILFVHGWGFDAGFWSVLAELLPQYRSARSDRGYFGQPCEAQIDGPVLVVAHSFGVMDALSNPPSDCRGLIAINGFDHFVARDGAPGVAPRVLDQMIRRFESEPEVVLTKFRQRCGSDAPFGHLDAELLLRDLMRLRDEDFRAEAARWDLPILSLQGGQDPLLHQAMREKVFAGAPKVQREVHPTGGHLLPISEADYCAKRIAAFIERLP